MGKQKDSKPERKAKLWSGGLCGPGSQGVLSYRKWRLKLKNSKPGNENIRLPFRRSLMQGYEEELEVSSQEGVVGPLPRRPNTPGSQ